MIDIIIKGIFFDNHIIKGGKSKLVLSVVDFPDEDCAKCQAFGSKIGRATSSI